MDRVQGVLGSVDGPWLLHYAGHVGWSGTLGQWQIGLAGRAVIAEDFASMASKHTLYLVFLNGCRTFGEAFGVRTLPSLGALFLENGIPLIGTLSPAEERSAHAFAEAFYRAFLPPLGMARGQTLGAAALKARLAIRT